MAAHERLCEVVEACGGVLECLLGVVHGRAVLRVDKEPAHGHAVVLLKYVADGEEVAHRLGPEPPRQLSLDCSA